MIITPLKILHLEDLPDDAEMVARELKKTIKHAEILHVDNKEDYIKALENFSPDIILSDHSLPSFDSHEALAIILKGDFSIPFILVTATVSEEYAVEIIKEGADDYILKERLQRLPAAIENALERRKAEGARKKAEDTLRASERKYKLLFDHNPLPMWMISKSTLEIIAVNEAAVSHYGYTREEFLHMNSRDLRPAEDAEQMMTAIRQDYTASKNLGVWRHLKKDGTIILVDVVAHDVLLEGNMVRLILGNDVTERLRSEEAMAKQQVMQQHLITETSIRAQEKEREEIGKELHDNINQLLATAVLFMDFAVRKTVSRPGRLPKAATSYKTRSGKSGNYRTALSVHRWARSLL
ncbi:MAG: PAS domain S-box protein [Bacteroidota bacterium]